MFFSPGFQSPQRRSASGARSHSRSPRGARGPFASHRRVRADSPRGLLAETATATPRIEKEQVENAFCLRVGSKRRERIYLRRQETF